MKLFNDFEAIKFEQENMIFITKNSWLYYIYNHKYNRWEKFSDAGNVLLTVSNYSDVSTEELSDAMNGVFPKSENDFRRLCYSSQLYIRDMMSLLKEDYANYLSDCSIDRAIHYFLLESDICYKSYEFIRTLLDDAISNQYNNAQVLNLVKELSLRIIGRDIFERKIEIIDGHDSSSYFWIMPVKIIDYTDTNDLDNVAEMRGVEISIEENNVEQYLLPFLYKHFDDELEANRHRKSVSSFQWYLTYNFFSFDSITAIINDIKDTIAVLSAGRDNEFTEKLKIKRGLSAHKLIYAKNFSKEEIDSYNANRPKVNDTETDLIIDFYRRFIYRMEYMLKVGEEKGYNLISFMGP